MSMTTRAMSNAERLELAELTSSIEKAKADLDRINHGQLFNRAVSERATAKIAELERARDALRNSYPGRLG